MNATNERTAHILAKLSKTDPEYQQILVRPGSSTAATVASAGTFEFYHPQLLRWCELPKAWEAETAKALAE